MDVKSLNKLKLSAGSLIFIIGITHLIEGFLSIELIELSITAFIYSGFFMPLGLGLLRILRKNELDETKSIIIYCTTVSLLNAFTSFTQILTADVSQHYFLYAFMIWHFLATIFIFPILFYSKILLDKMNFIEIISYFSIVVIRGLGIGLLFQILAWLLPTPNYFVIMYILIFGIINIIFGQKLYIKKENKKIQVWGIVSLIVGGIIGTIVLIVNPNPKFVVFLLLYVIVILIRVYYLNRKF